MAATSGSAGGWASRTSGSTTSSTKASADAGPSPSRSATDSTTPYMKTFTSHDGTTWKVDVRMPGASNAMIVFRHPDGSTSRKDRYNWILNEGPEARSVTARLSP